MNFLKQSFPGVFVKSNCGRGEIQAPQINTQFIYKKIFIKLSFPGVFEKSNCRGGGIRCFQINTQFIYKKIFLKPFFRDFLCKKQLQRRRDSMLPNKHKVYLKKDFSQAVFPRVFEKSNCGGGGIRCFQINTQFI